MAAGHVRRETTDRPAYRSPNTVPCPDTVRPGARRFFRGQPSGPCWTLKGDVEKLEALLAAERERADKAIAAFEALAQRLEAMAGQPPGVVALAALLREGRMKPVNLAAQLAAAETELACLKMVLAQVKRTATSSGRSGTTGAGRPRSSTPRSSSPRSSERLMSGTPLPRSAAHGGVASREARSERLALCA